MTHHLPSTRGLQAFLAVLGTGSTVEAARSLNKTQSAISKQIANLEMVLRVPLFVRSGGGLEPTAAARAYEPHARIAIDTLIEGMQQLNVDRAGPRPLLLHLLPIIGERWLTDRFPSFEARFPDLEVQFTNQLSGETARPADAEFRHGKGDWPDARNLYLFGREQVLVAAPALVRAMEITSEADIARLTLLQHFQTPGLWEEYCRARGIAHHAPRRIVRYGFMSLVISAAISGSGAALVPRVFIKRDLDAGRLVMVGEPGFESQEGYWLCLLNRPAPHPGLPAFTSWVLEEATALTR